MAEYVEQRMEEMIPEVEELERVGLLSGPEVRELIKKRKHFEYKIQKRTKKKEDFFGYIEYETNLMNLIQLRRDEIGYHHKKGHIENGIKTRINKLYKILCHRWQSDTKIWLSYIDWLNKMKWKSSVSKTNLRLLQVHNNNPKLWIAAAKYEFENGAAENGRQILLRGLRFHPGCKHLHREYIKFELLFVEKLRARQKVLSLEKDEEVTKEEEKKDEDEEKEDEENDDDSEDEIEKLEKEKKKREKKERKDKMKDEVDDKILNFGLVNLVLEAALVSIPEPEFAVSLLVSVRQFPGTLPVQQNILNILEQTFNQHPVNLDTRARMCLEKDGKMADRIRECCSLYTNSLEEKPSQELFHLAFSTLKELPLTAPSCSRLIMSELLKLLKFGQKNELLDVEEYGFWLRLIKVEGNEVELKSLTEDALRRFPDEIDFWLLKLSLDLRLGGDEYKNSFQVARAAVKVETKEKLWTGFITLMNKAGRAEDAYIQLQDAAVQENCGELRVLLLERTREKGVEACRGIYSRFANLPPFKEEFFNTMLEIELEQPKVIKKNVREVYTSVCTHYGTTSVQCWLDWIQWEEKTGSALEISTIVCRAEATLPPNLRNKFTTLREMQSI